MKYLENLDCYGRETMLVLMTNDYDMHGLYDYLHIRDFITVSLHIYEWSQSSSEIFEGKVCHFSHSSHSH